MRALVVPTNRPDGYQEFWAAWVRREQAKWDYVIVVEDDHDKTCGMPCDEHVCWQDIDQELCDQAWIISRRDSAIRSYGFWRAYQAGADEIFTLDDDCFPLGDLFIEQHLANLYQTKRWAHSIAGVRTRGLPYFQHGVLKNVMISHGLWCGVPDFDAVQTLAREEIKSFHPPEGTHVVPSGQYFPMCGMNLAFRREATPLMYFPLMGEGTPFRRFDDIWCGVMAKRVCDHLGWHIVTGEPFVDHCRASNVMVNLAKEAPGIGRNETFWSDVDAITLTEVTAAGCMGQIGENFTHAADSYLQRLGRALCIWSEKFQ